PQPRRGRTKKTHWRGGLTPVPSPWDGEGGHLETNSESQIANSQMGRARTHPYLFRERSGTYLLADRRSAKVIWNLERRLQKLHLSGIRMLGSPSPLPSPQGEGEPKTHWCAGLTPVPSPWDGEGGRGRGGEEARRPHPRPSP